VKKIPLDIDKHVMLACELDSALIHGELDGKTIEEIAVRHQMNGTLKYTIGAVRYVLRWMKRHGRKLPASCQEI
jgi:hypothetical protein